MNDQLSLEVWNRQVIMLMQALLGSISPNFRMVALAHENSTWRLLFVLESEDDEDRAEIEDIAIDFEALQERGVEYEIEVQVSRDPIPWPPPPTRVIFRRREP